MAQTTHHEGRAQQPTEADLHATVSTYEKELTLEQSSTQRSYRLFVGVDIASRDFTAAALVPGARPTRESHAYEQTTQGFERFQQRLQESGVPAVETLVVMEATGSYWIALATALYHAGFAVSVINPAQAHYFAKAQLKRAKSDVLDAQTIAELAQSSCDSEPWRGCRGGGVFRGFLLWRGRLNPVHARFT